MIRLHVLNDQIVRHTSLQRILHIDKPLLAERRIHRVYHRSLFVPYHVRIVGHTLRHLVLPLEKIHLMIIYAHIPNTFCHLHADTSLTFLLKLFHNDSAYTTLYMLLFRAHSLHIPHTFLLCAFSLHTPHAFLLRIFPAYPARIPFTHIPCTPCMHCFRAFSLHTPHAFLPRISAASFSHPSLDALRLDSNSLLYPSHPLFPLLFSSSSLNISIFASVSSA